MALIYILGNSPIFLKAMKLAYPDDKICVFSWRNCMNYIVENEELSNQNPDIVLVCGYDYGAASYPLKNYIDVNIRNPCRWVSAVASINTKIIYINTLPPSKKITYSRYLLAKNNLASCLQDNNVPFFNVHIATIVDKKMRPNIYGGIFSKLLFTLLIRLGFVKTNMEEKLIDHIALENLKATISPIPRLEGRFLAVPRNILLDRVLRILYG
jgi:hypothetical protein